ncbi:hypothetical protein [Capsulimonas corticalis]|nr:hypothetical protein [Capsulimonas corticalis]
MTIVLPILFFALFIGLTAQKITSRHWLVMIVWICAVLGWYYVKN